MGRSEYFRLKSYSKEALLLLKLTICDSFFFLLVFFLFLRNTHSLTHTRALHLVMQKATCPCGESAVDQLFYAYILIGLFI